MSILGLFFTFACNQGSVANTTAAELNADLENGLRAESKQKEVPQVSHPEFRIQLFNFKQISFDWMCWRQGFNWFKTNFVGDIFGGSRACACVKICLSKVCCHLRLCYDPKCYDKYCIIGNLKFGSLLSYEGLSLSQVHIACHLWWVEVARVRQMAPLCRPTRFTATRQSVLINIQAASDRLWSVNFFTCFTKKIRIQSRSNIKDCCDWTLRHWWRALSVFLCFQLLILWFS